MNFRTLLWPLLLLAVLLALTLRATVLRYRTLYTSEGSSVVRTIATCYARRDSAWVPEANAIRTYVAQDVYPRARALLEDAAARARDRGTNGLDIRLLDVRMGTCGTWEEMVEIEVDIQIDADREPFIPGPHTMEEVSELVKSLVSARLREMEDQWRARTQPPEPSIARIACHFLGSDTSVGRVVMDIVTPGMPPASERDVVDDRWWLKEPAGPWAERVTCGVEATRLPAAFRVEEVMSLRGIRATTKWVCVIKVGERIFRTTEATAELTGGQPKPSPEPCGDSCCCWTTALAGPKSRPASTTRARPGIPGTQD